MSAALPLPPLTERHRLKMQDRKSQIENSLLQQKKFANFNEFSEIKKIRKNSYKNWLNALVGVAFQWNSLLI